MVHPLVWSLLILIGLASPGYTHIGGTIYPIFGLTDSDLAAIDLRDGSVAEWDSLLPFPSIVAEEFFADPTVGDGAQYDPNDLNHRTWLAWHGATGRLYVAIERIDDVYLNEYEGNGPLAYPGGIWQNDSIEFMVDGDHSGGDFTGNADPSWTDEERMLNNNRTAQQYLAIASSPDGHTLGYAGVGTWVNRPPYADGGGGNTGGTPDTSVIEFYVTPFDDLRWNSPEESVASPLYTDKIIGWSMSVPDWDVPGRYHAFHALAGSAATWRYAESFVDGRLIGPGQDFNAGNPDFERGDLSHWISDPGGVWTVSMWGSRSYPGIQGIRYATTCGDWWRGDGECRISTHQTGVLRTEVFRIGARYLTFRLAGFSGRRGERGLNLVRLCRATTGQVLIETPVPYQHPFRDYRWDLERYRGESVYFEAVDGDDGEAWGWIAVDALNLTDSPPDHVVARPEGLLVPAKGTIAFAAERQAGMQEGIYLINADGLQVRPLIDTPCRELTPAWSPDGLSLAFAQECGEERGIRVLDLTAGVVRSVYDGEGRYPTWSPDGREIAFADGPGGLGVVEASSADSVSVRGVGGSLGAAHPAWSPDGAWLAFTRGYLGLVGEATGRYEDVSDQPIRWREWVGYPAWSPDGAQVAVVRDQELWVAPLALRTVDGNETWYLDTGQARQLTQGYSFVSRPAWSPDGQYLAFASSRDGDNDVYVVEISTGRVQQLTDAEGEDTAPAWVPRPGTTAIADAAAALPTSTCLYPPYPNPFNGAVILRFELARAGTVHLGVYDLLGQEVATLVDGDRPAGNHQVAWDGRDQKGQPAASGVYLCVLQTAGQRQVHRLALVR